jgi:hypothetical protein
VHARNCGTLPPYRTIGRFCKGESAITRMKAILVVLFLSALAAPSWAQTYTAANCNFSSVNALINGPTHTAVSGDTIVIPTGTCTWSSNLNGPSGVGFTLIGTGTPNSGSGTTGASSSCTATQIIDNAGSSNPLMTFTPNYGTGTMRVSCLDIEPNSSSTALTAPIQISGNCTSSGCPSFRIDNIMFGLNTQWSNSGNSSQSGAVNRADNAFGVLDHNTIPSGSQVELFNAQLTAYLGVGAYGDNSWAQPDSLGGANNIFAENNLFYSTYLSLNDCEAGSIGGCRVVDRYNTLTASSSGAWGIFENHGTETAGRGRSGREAEVYNNTITCMGACTSVDGGLRGGTGMFFNNHGIVTPGQGANTWLGISLYRNVFTAFPWGACGGSASWDKNDGTVYYSGTIGSVSNGNLTMVDSTKNFGNLTPIGDPFSVYDVTQGWWGEVTSNNGTNITVLSTISEQSPYGFSPGDSYQILRAQYCVDQPGRGQGNYLSGTTPAPTGYPNQALDPIYQWGEYYTGGANVNAPMNANSGKVIAYRDYYAQASGVQTNATSPFSCNGSTGGTGWGTLANRPSGCSGACSVNSPGCGYFATDQGTQGTLYVWSSGAWTSYYAPYTYPHPLTQGTVSTSPPPPPPPNPPGPPTNLSATGH